MHFAVVFLGFCASIVLAAPTPSANADASPAAEADPQFSISGPLGSLSLGGLRGGGGFEAEGPLGSISSGGLRDLGGSVSGPLGDLSWGSGARGGDDD